MLIQISPSFFFMSRSNKRNLGIGEMGNKKIIMGAGAPPTFSRIEANSSACLILMKSAIQVLTDVSYTTQAISQAIVPFFAIDFSRHVIQRIEPYKMTAFLNRLRGPKLDRAHYRALVAHIRDPLIDDSLVFSPQLEEWRAVIVRHNLTERISLPDWIPIINHLGSSLITRPSELAQWLYPDIAALASTSPESGAILGLYQASVVATSVVPSATPASSWQLLSSAHTLAADIRVASVADTSCARDLQSARASLDLPDNYDRLGPAAKIRCLAESTAPQSVVVRFLNTGAQVNILHQVQDSLKSVASGIQCYASFCDLIQTAYFPPATENILRWSTLFSPGRSFGQYLSHVSKACQLLNLPLTWITPAVRGVAKGLANAQDISFRFDNFIQKELFIRLIRFELLSSEVGRLFYLSYLFLLRVPSEGLPIQRAAVSDVITTKAPQEGKALLGIRVIGDSPRLVLKLKKRKLNKTGAIMMRPCFCDGTGLVPAGLCPLHNFWPLIQQQILPGELLFPSLQNKNLNRILKAILKRMGVESAEKYSTKAFRRGAAMDIMASGSALAQIMRSAGWHSQAFRAYLIFQMEEECNMKAIFASSNRSKTTKPRTAPKPTVTMRHDRSTIIDISSGTESSSSSLSGRDV